MATYDPAVIQKFADRLYKQARNIVLTYSLLGALIGGVLGYVFLVMGLRGNEGQTLMPIAVSLLFLVAGYAIGTERSFKLRLQAQTALCQAKIEENTRR